MASPRTNRRRISCATAALALAVVAGMALTTETQARRASPLDELRSSLNELFSPPRRARRAKPRQARSEDSPRQRGSETRGESPSPARSVRPERPDEKPRARETQPLADRAGPPGASIPAPRPRPPEAPPRQHTARLAPPKASEPPRRPAPGERRAVPATPVPENRKGATEVPKSAESPDPQVPAPEAPKEPSACQLRLTPDVAVIRALPPITGPGECAAEDVVLLEKVVDRDGRAIAIAPPATLRCPMAESVVHWIRDDVATTARNLGAALKSVTVDTSFECRSRNRIAGAKLSEHGRANAIDLRGFTLANGKSFTFTDVAADKGARERLRQSACARFTTVLGPGSDGYHESHVHLDGIERRGGYRMCQWDVRDTTVIAAMPLPPERPASAPPRDAKAAKSGDRR